MIKEKSPDTLSALSHDMRTPLTALLCYLDLLADQNYPDPETMALYLKTARSRALQIRDLNEQLYELTASPAAMNSFCLEPFDGIPLISSLVETMQQFLTEKKFCTEFDVKLDRSFTIYADSAALSRLFDNMAANIIKFAAPSSLVSLKVSLTDHCIQFKQKNTKSLLPVTDSSHLGLIFCRHTVAEHHGILAIYDAPDLFEISISLPIQLM